MEEKLNTNIPARSMLLNQKYEQDLVSIIVITYNSVKYVIDALESAKAQTYKDIELIISDDASKDDTVKLCRKWVDENRNRFVRTEILAVDENRGIPANCNRAFGVSQGEWIKLIAGDDMLLPGCLEENIKYIKKNSEIKVLFSYLNMYLDDFKPINFIQKFPSHSNCIFFNSNITASEQYRLLLLSNRIHSTASVFISREALLNVGGFDEKYKHIEDYPLWLRLTKEGYKMHFMNQITANYRKHDGSIHNFKEKIIIKPSYLKNKQLMEDYVYPNLPILVVINFRYIFWLSSALVLLNLNKDIVFNRILHKVLLNYFNPFRLIIRLSNTLRNFNSF